MTLELDPVIIMAVVLIAIVLLGLLVALPFMRFHLCWRIFSALFCSMLLWLRLTPPSPPNDHDWGVVVFVLPAIVYFTLMTIRLAIGLFVSLRASRDPQSGQPTVPGWIDVPLALWISSILTLELFIWLSWDMIHFSYPLTLHIALVGTGLVLLAGAFLRSRQFARFMKIGSGLSVIVLTAISYLYFPSIVIQAAERSAEGKPFCIEKNRSFENAERWGDLTFLTIRKAVDSHFHVSSEDGRSEWSFYQRQFDPESKRPWVFRDTDYFTKADRLDQIDNCYNRLMENLRRAEDSKL